jgi:hypothetical protein
MTDANPSISVLNKKALAKLASTLLQEVTTQKTQDGLKVEALIRQSDTLLEASHRLAASHSGSNFGYHGALYYRDFEIPPMGSMFNVEWGGIHGIPPGWKKREPEEVKRKIESLASVTFENIEDGIKAPLASAKKLHRELLIQLAPLHQLPEGIREKQLLDGLERFDWKDLAKNEYATAALKSFPNMTRDSAAFTQGVMFTSHSYYEAVAAQVEKSAEAIEEFWNSTDRLLRQLQQAETQSLVFQHDPTDSRNLAAKYERLKVGILLLASVACSTLLAGAARLALQKWPWQWLRYHPNSYSIQWLSFTVLLLFFVGLFVRKFRNYCWGFALIPLLVGVLQSLGGPPHSP